MKRMIKFEAKDTSSALDLNSCPANSSLDCEPGCIYVYVSAYESQLYVFFQRSSERF